MIERRAKLSQGDIIGDFQVPPVPGAIEAGHTEYAIVLPHSCHFDNKGTNYCPVAVAWRLSSLQQLLDLNTDAKGNLVANKYLGKFVFAAPDIGADEYLVVDLGHIITLPTAEIVAGTKWSLDEEATLALQNAITNFFALRDITRKKMLPSFVGRTIRDIRAVPIGGNRARIEIVFTDESEDTLILYQQPVKT